MFPNYISAWNLIVSEKGYPQTSYCVEAWILNLRIYKHNKTVNEIPTPVSLNQQTTKSILSKATVTEFIVARETFFSKIEVIFIFSSLNKTKKNKDILKYCKIQWYFCTPEHNNHYTEVSTIQRDDALSTVLSLLTLYTSNHFNK